MMLVHDRDEIHVQEWCVVVPAAAPSVVGASLYAEESAVVIGSVPWHVVISTCEFARTLEGINQRSETSQND